MHKTHHFDTINTKKIREGAQLPPQTAPPRRLGRSTSGAPFRWIGHPPLWNPRLARCKAAFNLDRLGYWSALNPIRWSFAASRVFRVCKSQPRRQPTTSQYATYGACSDAPRPNSNTATDSIRMRRF